MYLSRLHFTNGAVAVAIDSLTGGLLEITDCRTGDNIIKSNAWNIPGTFIIHTRSGEKLTIPSSGDVYADSSLKPDIQSRRTDEGLLVTVSYAKLKDADCSCRYTILIEDGASALRFAMKTDANAQKCEFPVINGVWLGESYEDDTLVYPFNAGIKLENPVVSMAKPAQHVYWRWQDYRYVYNLKGMGLAKNADGFYSFESRYSGPLSMAYCDLYDVHSGMCFCITEPSGIVSIAARTRGMAEPGMCFAGIFYVPENEKCRKMEAVLFLHGASWHEGADFYRSRRGVDKPAPSGSFMGKSTGLAAHYDFKYQCGGIVHRFSDIHTITDQALAMGLDHLLVAGWHSGGFDNGFPQYWIDEQLGTFEELAAGIAYAHSRGVKVSFYVNSRLANLKYPISELLKRPAASKRAEGSVRSERYGDESHEFAIMCAGAQAWQTHLENAFKYLKSAGADGIYLDQIAMAAPCECYDTTHGHPADAWNEGCRTILKSIKALGLNVIIEGCSDLYGDLADGQLVSTFSYIDCAFPELYKYTYPAQTLVDMVYPKRNMAMRPVFVGNNQKRLNDTAFMTDSYFWVYDLVDDNTFTRDPESLEYLKKTLSLRTDFHSRAGKMTFCDTRGIVSATQKATVFEGEGLTAVCFSGEGSVLLDGRYTEVYCVDINDKTIRLSADGKNTLLTTKGTQLGFVLLSKKLEESDD